jgi:hypothetical protein
VLRDPLAGAKIPADVRVANRRGMCADERRRGEKHSQQKSLSDLMSALLARFADAFRGVSWSGPERGR